MKRSDGPSPLARGYRVESTIATEGGFSKVSVSGDLTYGKALATAKAINGAGHKARVLGPFK